MPDEVRLQRLGLVAERERAQAGLEPGGVNGDGEHWLTHVGEAMQIRCGKGPQALEQLVLDTGSTKRFGIGPAEPHRNVVQHNEPDLRVL